MKVAQLIKQLSHLQPDDDLVVAYWTAEEYGMSKEDFAAIASYADQSYDWAATHEDIISSFLFSSMRSGV